MGNSARDVSGEWRHVYFKVIFSMQGEEDCFPVADWQKWFQGNIKDGASGYNAPGKSTERFSWAGGIPTGHCLIRACAPPALNHPFVLVTACKWSLRRTTGTGATERILTFTTGNSCNVCLCNDNVKRIS